LSFGLPILASACAFHHAYAVEDTAVRIAKTVALSGVEISPIAF